MATKMKVFALKPENSQVITDFLNTVDVAEQGFLINEGNLGIVYKDQETPGRDRRSLMVAAIEELGKAQKNVVMRELDIQAFGDMKVIYKAEKEAIKAELEAVVKELGEYATTHWDKNMEEAFLKLKSDMGGLEKKHKQASKTEKPAILEEIYKLGETIKPAQEAFESMKKTFEEGKKKLEVKRSELEVKEMNKAGDYKQAGINYDTSVKEKAEAVAAVKASWRVLKDIENGKLEAEMAPE